mmetsp:Transcript_8780/g.12212  ORF Transcript_8780/g.12212 Transcript_8780/m.12212 type:complete len:458 (+) Transcript_8780:73-1446(+)
MRAILFLLFAMCHARLSLRRKGIATKPKKSTVVKENLDGILAVGGGTLCHMVLGTMYCWGNFIAYAPPELQYYSGKLESGQPDALAIIPMTIIFQMLAMPMGAQASKMFGTRTIAIFSGLLISIAVYASSYAKNLKIFMLLYAALFGTGIGLGYTPPMIAGWTWFPKSRGVVNGLVLLGFGAGGFIVNFLGSHLVNPGGKMIIDPNTGRFPDQLYNKFPIMLRKLAIIYALATILGGSQVVSKRIDSVTPSQKVIHTPTSNGISLRKAPRTLTFWALYAIIMLTASSGLTSASIYKLFANATPSIAVAGDQFLAIVGALGALFNGIGRLACAAAVDTYGYKLPFFILVVVQATNTALYPFIARTSPTAFLASTCISFFLLGGIFSTSPTAAALAFGPETAPLIYSLMFSAFAFASVGGVKLAKQLIPLLGWTSLYHVLALLTFTAAPLITVLKLNTT